MIIVKVHYGLGNQLFQYALARSLALQKDSDVYLDISFFNGEPDKHNPRVYQLNQFNILENIINYKIVDEFVNPTFLQRRMRSLLNTVTPYYKRRIVNETRFDFDGNVFNIKDNTYLVGYWQDVRYFSAVEEVLRKELTFKSDATGVNKDYLDRIRNSNAVSVHLRRGDYLTDAFTMQNVGICDLQYYYKAAEMIARQVNDPVFYIFSDEISWAEKNFKIEYPTVFINHNSQENSYEDLRLMSNCKHHITANSSFSWWGAWLGMNKEKLVIAPRVWRSKGPNMFLPEKWLAL